MQGVKIWEETMIIPTYEIGEADRNPIFSANRVYQGSSGKVYPYPVVESVSDTKADKEYRVVVLENRYIKTVVMPQLGGRIQRAYDKTNGYDFVYYNHVIKPALVGLTGPWISGGIEINWPQHHRPTTYLPTDYLLRENADGSKSVLIHDVDQMYATESVTAFTLYPDKAYIEIHARLYNGTAMPQTFLWWANPAFAVNEHTQSVFPPDVHAVMDHGKRDVSAFPIATGVYYKQDYSEGVDISWYKNIPVPTSFMAESSKYDFVGGYDHGAQAGILHVADHHISPGKKQWTWGCGDFGKAWDRNLTDGDGPYIELMTGVYTDNQPDFTWLKPFEEKTFKQVFMPYKGVGCVKNATIDAALNVDVQSRMIRLSVYTTAVRDGARIVVRLDGRTVYRETVDLSPERAFHADVELAVDDETRLAVSVLSEQGATLVSYAPEGKGRPALPDPAEAAADPKDIRTNEELYLTGLHLEQYRHATYQPDGYYLEGLRRDEGDIRINTAYGSLLLGRGQLEDSEPFFRKAIKRLSWKNPNPYDAEAFYKLGVCLFWQRRGAEAYDVFYKAAWSDEQREKAYTFMAAIMNADKRYDLALEHIENALIKNVRNSKARGLKAIILRNLGRIDEERAWLEENLAINPFDYVSAFLKALCCTEDARERDAQTRQTCALMRGFPENFLQTARDCADAGEFELALAVIRYCARKHPLLYYYQAYYLYRMGRGQACRELLEQAEAADSAYCFPNKIEDMLVLEQTASLAERPAKALYYLGNLYYDKGRHIAARECWERSAALDGAFPTALRNLALVYYNHCDMPQEARGKMEAAFALDPSDARVFLELDQLYKKIGYTARQRLEFYHRYKDTFVKRDDVFIEYVTLQNYVGRHEDAYRLIMSRRFHPWEGGEGKVAAQYATALTHMAKQEMDRGEWASAKEKLERALHYPENLGEGKLEGAGDHDIYYYLGRAYQELKDADAARSCFERAAKGCGEPAGMMYYNDQPADMILFQGLALSELGQETAAGSKFSTLTAYGQAHMTDEIRMGYFAVSYPDFMIFKEDFTAKNQAHCWYLLGLGKYGMGEYQEARACFEKAGELDSFHLKSALYARDSALGARD